MPYQIKKCVHAGVSVSASSSNARGSDVGVPMRLKHSAVVCNSGGTREIIVVVSVCFFARVSASTL